MAIAELSFKKCVGRQAQNILVVYVWLHYSGFIVYLIDTVYQKRFKQKQL